jgi:hypothetical protein
MFIAATAPEALQNNIMRFVSIKTESKYELFE